MSAAITARPAYVEGKGILIVEATSDPSVFLVHSQTEPNKKYTVAIPSSASPACECGDYMFRGNRNCKHIRSVSQQIQESSMSDQDWSSTPPTIDPFLAQAKLYAALAKAQSEVHPATKDTTGQIGQNRNYRYADLGAVEEVIRAPLANNGLAIVQLPGLYVDGYQHLKNIIVHEGGGSLEWEMSIPCKNDAQGAGSGLTYARRYALLGIMRVITEDDDGKGAMPTPNRDTYQRETPAPRPAQEATRDSANAPSVSQGQIGGAPNLAQMMARCRSTQFPSTGMMGAFLAGSDALCAPTEELVEAWFDRNPGAQGDQLLTEAGAWYESQPWAVDGMKLRARKWREEQRVAA